MKKYLLILLFSAIYLPTQAQFSGAYAPANWTLGWLYPASNGSINTSGAPGFIILTGDNDCSGDMDTYGEYSIVIPYCGEITFDYNWVNNDASTAEEAYYTVNGFFFFIANPTGTGTIGPINVNAGDNFAFVVNSPGADCGGNGVLTISNFSGAMPLPLNATASQFVACPGSLITLSASNADSYTWSNGATTDSTIITVTSDTMFTVVGGDFSSGCTTIDTVVIDMINCAGLEDNEELAVSIYPNPSTDWLFMETDATNLDYRIYDINGKQVQNGILSNQKMIPVDQLTKGVYILYLNDKGVTKRTRFIKN